MRDSPPDYRRKICRPSMSVCFRDAACVSKWKNIREVLRCLLFVLALVSGSRVNCAGVAPAALRVLEPSANGISAAQSFERWLLSEFNALVDKRSAELEKTIKSEAACRAWQKDRRDFFPASNRGITRTNSLESTDCWRNSR